jgi:hypothetical protein
MSSLGSLAGKWNIVWNWINNIWYGKHFIYPGVPGQPLATFDKEKAYWVRMRPEQEANWSQAPKKVTLLVYMEGTDLEDKYSCARRNILEMLNAGSSPDVNIVLNTGGAAKANDSDPVKSWSTVKRHIVKEGKLVELHDLGAQVMGTYDNMKDFIIWGQNAFPADKYILVFWDHGGGSVRGYGDEYMVNKVKVVEPAMVYTIRSAILDAIDATGKTFELIGFNS